MIQLRITNDKGKISNVYYYHKNHLGSITSISDNKGKVIESYDYDIFGKAYKEVNVFGRRVFSNRLDSQIDNTRLYTGREYDKEIGLYYYRARYYSAEFGRFISRDPIGQVDDINLYSYVGNSPVGRVDPMGLAECSASKMIYNSIDYTKRAISDSIDYTEKMTNEAIVYGMVHSANSYTYLTKNINNSNYGKWIANKIGLSGFEDMAVTSYMLHHAVFGNGKNLYITNDDIVGQKLQKTTFYQNIINNAKYYADKNGNINYTVNRTNIGESFDFENGFGTIAYSLTGKVNANGTIETHFHITDSYIFNDLGDPWLIHNNSAYISQENKLAITPYMYYVDIYNINKK